MESAKTLLTGIKPTGQTHLGNYAGAIQPALQKINEIKGKSYLFIADYHSLTHIHNPKQLNQAVYDTACSLLASGLDVSKTIMYRQSNIPELYELYWIISCLTPKGLMNRAHSYKAQIQLNINQKKEEIDYGVFMGTFNYPMLMAADILLFQADIVPVGQDQLQHLEITRDIASKFNRLFRSSLMKLPHSLDQNKNSNLPGIDGRKMSKSYNNHIPLFCSSKELKKKIMQIKTDSSPKTAPKDPQTSTLFHLYSSFATFKQSQSLKEKMKKGIGWGEIKLELFNLLEQQLSPKRKIYNSLVKDQNKIDQILKEGAMKARKQSTKMLQQVRKVIGIQ